MSLRHTLAWGNCPRCGHTVFYYTTQGGSRVALDVVDVLTAHGEKESAEEHPCRMGVTTPDETLSEAVQDGRAELFSPGSDSHRSSPRGAQDDEGGR